MIFCISCARASFLRCPRGGGVSPDACCSACRKAAVWCPTEPPAARDSETFIAPANGTRACPSSGIWVIYRLRVRRWGTGAGSCCFLYSTPGSGAEPRARISPSPQTETGTNDSLDAVVEWAPPCGTSTAGDSCTRGRVSAPYGTRTSLEGASS